MGIKNALSLFFLVIGGFLLLIGVIQTIGTLVFLSRAEPSQARVIDYEIVENAAPFMASSRGAGLLFYPILQFETPQGGLVTFTADQGHRERPYDVDSRVGILYDPGTPQSSRVDDFWGLWGRVVIFAGLGAVFGGLGLLTPFGFSRVQRHNPYHSEPEV
jgi:hypothetical protein